jgi:magnesium-transporting ATPase (P-type)
MVLWNARCPLLAQRRDRWPKLVERTDRQTCIGNARCPKLAMLEFDRNRKSMSVICSRGPPSEGRTRRSAQRSNVLLVKGAAECVLGRCSKVGQPGPCFTPLPNRDQMSYSTCQIGPRASYGLPPPPAPPRSVSEQAQALDEYRASVSVVDSVLQPNGQRLMGVEAG